jgi:hypothetical protein
MATNAPQAAAPGTDPQNARLNFEEAKTIADWVALLNDENNPPLGEEVATILKCLPSDPNDLPGILKLFESDDLREKILRLVNDVYFNPSELHLERISRATVVLGFRTLRSLGLCAAVISYLLKNAQEESFKQEIALVLHSATLAGIIAKRKIRSINCEPVVTATLFFSLGKLIFMCFGGGTAKKYNEILATSKITPEEEFNIIGFLLKDLTIDLGKKWFIGPTLVKAQELATDDEIINIIHLSRKIVERHKEDWEANPFQETIRELGSFLGIPFPQAKNLILEGSLRALETFGLFSESLMDLIHLPEAAQPVDTLTPSSDEIKLNPSRVTASIQEMSILLGNQISPSMSDLIAVGLRGMRNSLDVDRALFSLLSQDRLNLKGKSIDEKKNSGFLNDFKFELNAPEGWLFQCLLRNGKPAWIGGENKGYTVRLRNESLNKKIGKGEFFIAPFILQGNIMGFYFIDRQVTGRSLDQTTFEAFKELCTTINGFVELIMLRAKQKK